MRPVSLSLNGFASYREPQTVDFENVSLACITGHNGAGKSSLFQGMEFSLFGHIADGDIDSVVNDGSDQAEVGFVFDHAGERYRVTRTRVRGKKTSARIERFVDGEFQTFEASGVKAVDHEIEKLIRISPETFATTVLMAQDDAGRFAKASPAERKQILSEIIGLDQYQELAKRAREYARLSRQSHSALQEEIDSVDVKLAGADDDMTALLQAKARLDEMDSLVIAARSSLDTVNAALSLVASAKERLAVIETRANESKANQTRRRSELATALAKAEQGVARLSKALNEAQQKVRRAEEAESLLPALSVQLTNIAEQLGQLEKLEERTSVSGQEAKNASGKENEEIARLTSVLTDAEERARLLGYDSAECFTCGQSLTTDLRHNLIANVDYEIDVIRGSIASATERHEYAEGLIGILQGELASYRAEKEEARVAHATALLDLQRATELAQTKSTAVEALAEMQTERDTAQLELEVTKEAFASGPGDFGLLALAEEEKGLRSAVEAVAEQELARSAAQAKLNELEAEKSQLLKLVGTLEERIAGYESLRTSRDNVTAKAAESARDATDWQLLARAFGQDGVPNLVFAGAARELERDATDLMDRLTGGRYRLEMRTEKVNKGDGETVEALEIVVVADSGKERPFARLSGGEKFRVTLVLHTSLTRFLVRRSGAPIEFLGVDEGWGSLDPEGIIAMLDALRMLHDEFPLILTITHTPEVAAAFECRYEVEKDADGTSVVTLVSS
jgi:exonuclease SbcC